MTKKNQKGFTLAELVIVITVIAILAAVLIPTFVSLVKKANISNDTTLAKNMNDFLSTSTGVQDMQEVLDIVGEGGISIEKFNPTTEGYRFLWEKVTNQIVFVNDKYEVKYQSKDFKEDKEFWLTIRKQSDIVYPTKMDLNYFLAKDLTGNLEITKLADFDTGNFNLNGTLKIKSTGTGDVTLNGDIKNVTLDVPNAEVYNYATVETMDVQAVASSSLENNAYVGQANIIKGNFVNKVTGFVGTLGFGVDASAVTIENVGYIETVIVTNMPTEANTFVNKGSISKVDTGTLAEADANDAVGAIDNSEGYVAQTTGNAAAIQNTISASDFAVTISDLKALESFRDAVNKGASYKGVTVSLINDITLRDGWTPIGAFARDGSIVTQDKWGFAGTFDGNGKTISNLDNTGFEPSNAMYNQNSTTIKGAKEYAYGLFGCVQNATIKNLKIADVNINIPTVAKYNGDSVGAFVGYAFNGVEILDCEAVNGTISARDGVAGIVGRIYSKDGATTATIADCTNNLAINGQAKVAGIVGFTNNGLTVSITGCINNGAITADSDGDVKNSKNEVYVAGIVVVGGTGKAHKIRSNENNGLITLNNKKPNGTSKISAVCLSFNGCTSIVMELNDNTAELNINDVKYGETEAAAQLLANKINAAA